MSRILAYALYEMKIFLRVKVAVFYSIIFPIVLLLGYYFAYHENGNNINDYFPYLLSITMLSTAGGLASIIVNNRIFNIWKFYQFYGYRTGYLAVASGLVYFIISEIISLILIFIMMGLGVTEISISSILLFMLATGLGMIVYIQIAVITGLCLKDVKTAQTVINGLTYVFVILSGSVFQFNPDSILGKIIALFPNIHLGHILYGTWNSVQINNSSIIIVACYIFVFFLLIGYLLKKEQKRLFYKKGGKNENN